MHRSGANKISSYKSKDHRYAIVPTGIECITTDIPATVTTQCSPTRMTTVPQMVVRLRIIGLRDETMQR